MFWVKYVFPFTNLPHPAVFATLALIGFVWALIWKGMALWRAAHNGDKVWFVVLLVVNTLGILEILYLYVWGKPKSSPPQQM